VRLIDGDVIRERKVYFPTKWWTDHKGIDQRCILLDDFSLLPEVGCSVCVHDDYCQEYGPTGRNFRERCYCGSNFQHK
jgi:hypothetical protein